MSDLVKVLDYWEATSDKVRHQVLLLLKQLWPDDHLDEKKIENAFKRGLRSSACMYLKAERNDDLIGFGSLCIKISLWQAGDLAHINELIVDAAFRGRGVGALLLEELVQRARASGCSRVELDTAYDRQAAHKFYETHGFAKRGHLFTRNI